MTAERSAVEELVYRSCLTLDRNDYAAYLDLCDTGFEYRLSAWSPEIRNEMTWIDNSRAELEGLFKTLPRHNSDRSPLTRNAQVYTVEFDSAAATAQVVTALTIYRTRLDGGRTELYAVGKYHDTVKLDADGPKLLARHVRLDTRDLGWGSHIPF